MEYQTCQNCKHFRQHYGLEETRIFRVYCGHCVLSRIKNKKPDQKACEKFAQKENKEKDFVSKEYLSKFLLDWVRQLELLPEIKEENTP